MNSLFKMMIYLKKYKKKMIISFISLMIVATFNLVQPKIIEWIIDKGIAGNNLSLVLLGSGGILLAAVFAGGFDFLSARLLIASAQGQSYDLRSDIYKKVISFSFSNLDKWRTGELMVRVNSDVTTLRMFVRMGLFMLIQSILMLLGSLIIMFYTNAKLASVMAVILPFTLLVFFLIANKIRPAFLKVKEAQDKLNNILQENLSGVKVIKSFCSQDYEQKRFVSKNTDLLSISLKVGYVMSMMMPFLFFTGQIAIVATLWVGGLDVIENIINPQQYGLTIGQLVAFNNYAMMSMMPIMMLGMVLNFISMASASAMRLEELLSEKPSVIENKNAREVKNIEGNIEFQNVSFHYGNGENTLSNISFSINSGEKVGIVGGTGSGKSSLVSLIGRYYEAQSGKIMIDGVKIEDYSLTSLRKRVAQVLQETTLFAGSIGDNIRFGNSTASQETVERVAELSDCSDFIKQKKDGFEEEIGERGKGLSGGQRQRVAIARTLITDPDILILDDVTSALDAATEKKIIDNLYHNLDNKTILLISQKIESVMKADRILVLDDGKLIGNGSHEELLQSCDIYHELYETQKLSIN